ncbi:hypothetical protein [Kitasatospora azatica]|uniref:hypothetical protein n=1 Tax=Kitasatospora azatica TaxID=58347 RepID=UPI0012FC656A|nr:hypothetical protein [Kitasatospora azatica]
MHLVHVELHPPVPGLLLPPGIATLIRTAAVPHDQVEHVVVHRPALGAQVLGVFLVAERLEEAEARAEALCRRLLTELGELGGWALGRVGVPLIAPFYELLLAETGLAGLNRPRPFPST